MRRLGLLGALTCALASLASPVLASAHGGAPADEANLIGWFVWEAEHLLLHLTLSLSALYEGVMVGSPALAWHMLGVYAGACASESLATGFFFGGASASLTTLALIAAFAGGLVRWLIGRLRCPQNALA